MVDKKISFTLAELKAIVSKFKDKELVRVYKIRDKVGVSFIRCSLLVFMSVAFYSGVGLW